MKKILFTLIMVLIVVSFTELASFSFLNYQARQQDSSSVFTQRDGYSVRTPGTYSERRWGFLGGSYTYTVDEEGYRVGLKNYSPLLPKEDVYRIVTIGTSTTWGLSLNNHETWPSYLESILDSKMDGGLSRYQVLNYGKGGSETKYWVKSYPAEVMKVNPDLVIIELGNNDMGDRFWKYSDSDHEMARLYTNAGDIAFYPFGYTAHLVSKLFFNNLEEQIENIKNNSIQNYNAINLARKDLRNAARTSQSEIMAFKHRIKYLVDRIRGFNPNTRIVFLVWPLFDDLDHTRTKELFSYHMMLWKLPAVSFSYHSRTVMKVFEELAPELNVESIRISPRLDGSYYYDYCHINAEGNKIVADEIFENLVEKGLI